MTSLLALDLASKTGWAAWSPTRRLASGAVQMPATGDDVGWFLEVYEEWLLLALDEWLTQCVVFEAPILPSKTSFMTVRKLCGLANATELICRQRKILCREVHSQTWRSSFCGHARAPKEIKGTARRKWIKDKVKEACRDRGWDPDDDDEADALGILDYAAAALKLPGLPEGPLFKHRGKVA